MELPKDYEAGTAPNMIRTGAGGERLMEFDGFLQSLADQMPPHWAVDGVAYLGSSVITFHDGRAWIPKCFIFENHFCFWMDRNGKGELGVISALRVENKMLLEWCMWYLQATYPNHFEAIHAAKSDGKAN